MPFWLTRNSQKSVSGMLGLKVCITMPAQKIILFSKWILVVHKYNPKNCEVEWKVQKSKVMLGYTASLRPRLYEILSQKKKKFYEHVNHIEKPKNYFNKRKTVLTVEHTVNHSIQPDLQSKIPGQPGPHREILLQKTKREWNESWRDGPAIRSIWCSGRGPGLNSQNPVGSLKPPVTPVSGHPMPSSGLYGHKTHTQCTHTYTGKHQ